MPLQEISFNGRIYFSGAELVCKGSGQILLAPGFAEALLSLRLSFGESMPVTSCCRSKEHNAAVGGAPHSFHIYDDTRGGCRAIDIGIMDSARRHRLISLAMNQNWSIGINSNFIHLDRRVDIGDKPLVFLYGKGL